MFNLNNWLLVLALALVCGCAALENSLDPETVATVTSIDDVAQGLCAISFGDEMGVTVPEAAETYCDTREKFAPWIDPALASMKAGKLPVPCEPNAAPETPASGPEPEKAQVPPEAPPKAGESAPGPVEEGPQED